MDQENITIGQIVAQDYRMAKVFQKYSIDYCSQGRKTIKTACHEKNIPQNKLSEEIEEAKAEKQIEPENFNTWDLDALANHIVETHHKFSEKQSLKLKGDLDKLCEEEGKNHPELFEIRDIFKSASGEMASHMKKEEIILFPFIKRVLKAKESNVKIEGPFSRMEDPIDMMIHDHSDQLEGFKRIRALTDNYTPPAEVGDDYIQTYKLLHRLEQDLFKHIHLENNILFPKAVELGRKWTSN